MPVTEGAKSFPLLLDDMDLNLDHSEEHRSIYVIRVAVDNSGRIREGKTYSSRIRSERGCILSKRYFINELRYYSCVPSITN